MEKTIKTLICTNIFALLTIVVMLLIWQPFKAESVKAQTVTETVASVETVNTKNVKKSVKSKGFSFETIIKLSNNTVKAKRMTKVRR